MSFTLFPDTRRALAADSLAGLSVGDALGAQYFVPGNAAADLARGDLPTPPWPWTDDTEEACCLVAALTAGDEAEVTHAHPEGIAGGVAVTVAAAIAAAARLDGHRPEPGQLLAAVAAREPLPNWVAAPGAG